MKKFFRRLWQLLLRDFSVNSRSAQAEQLRAMQIGVRTSEEDVLMRLAELDKVLRHER